MSIANTIIYSYKVDDHLCTIVTVSFTGISMNYKYAVVFISYMFNILKGNLFIFPEKAGSQKLTNE